MSKMKFEYEIKDRIKFWQNKKRGVKNDKLYFGGEDGDISGIQVKDEMDSAIHELKWVLGEVK